MFYLYSVLCKFNNLHVGFAIHKQLKTVLSGILEIRYFVFSFVITPHNSVAAGDIIIDFEIIVKFISARIS